MTGKDFLKKVDCIFKGLGFSRQRHDYYCQGEQDLMVVIHPQKSAYGSIYYFNVRFALKKYDDKGQLILPGWIDSDTYSRIPNLLHQEPFYAFEYEEYDGNETSLETSIVEYANTIIFPTLAGGTTYILYHFDKFPYGCLRPRLKQKRDELMKN